MTGTVFVALVAVLLAFAAFQHWLRYKRRLLIHKERLAAIERGIELPPVDHEIAHRSRTSQRILLLAGLVWVSLGAGALSGDVSSLIGNPISTPLGVSLVGIGISHLIVFAIGRSRSDSPKENM
jgi:hypothetical protein